MDTVDTEIDQTIPVDSKTFQFLTSSPNTSLYNGGSSIEPVVMNESEPKPFYLQLFSAPFVLLKWVFSFRWYVTLIIIVLFFYLVFQIEYAFEERRNKHKITKEGMNLSKDEHKDPNTKRVTFSEEFDNKSTDSNTRVNNTKLKNFNIISDTYNNWIIPWIYMIFRNIGVTSK
jgi:hypothetical protein